MFGGQVWLLICLDLRILSNMQKVACTAQATEATVEFFEYCEVYTLQWYTMRFFLGADLFYCLLALLYKANMNFEKLLILSRFLFVLRRNIIIYI